MQRGVLAVAVALISILVALAFDARGIRHAGSVLIGAFAGIALYHASFGFTSAWRRLQTERRGTGFRAQMLLIGVTCAVTFPLLAHGRDLGVVVYGNILPMGLASAFGAFLFGAGMQVGGGCASGTLFTVGGGSTRMVVVLIAFVTGSVWATADIPGFWATLPRMPGVSLVREFGAAGGLALMLAVVGALAFGSAALERQRHGTLQRSEATRDWLRGPWSPHAGALALALVGVLALLVTQRPWGVTAGFALWGAQGGAALGIIDPASWPYWSEQKWRAAILAAGPFAHHTSLMNFGIIAGALAAAGLAGRFRPVGRLSRRDLVTAVIGGLAMGYGARLAYGCNIGAYLGGLVSGSAHGAWWLVFGFAGSVVGTRLRRGIGMDPVPTATSAGAVTVAAGGPPSGAT